MNKLKIRGSITIEASLILPWFLFGIMSIIYLLKVVYIHDQIQYALTESANSMASHAYILEKSEILNIQQDAYNNLSINSVVQNKKIPNEYAEGLTEYNINFFNSNLEDIKTTNVKQLLKEIKEFKYNIGQAVDTIYMNLFSAIYGLKILYEDTNDIITNWKKDGMEFANMKIGEKITKLYMSKYIPESKYNKWNIVNGINGMDYSLSQYMLKDDNIIIVVSYKVLLPFPLPKKIEIPIRQSIKVRGWTGSNDYIYSKENKEDNTTEMVYITPTGVKYHKATCTSVTLEIIELKYKDVKKHRTLCQICKKASKKLNDYSIVYGTREGNKYHIDKNCKGIKRNAIQIDKEEAINNYKPCLNCYKEDIR